MFCSGARLKYVDENFNYRKKLKDHKKKKFTKNLGMVIIGSFPFSITSPLSLSLLLETRS